MIGHPPPLMKKAGPSGPLPFIFTVTVGSGQSFQLPTVSSGTYNAVIDWGDSTSNALTVWNAAGRSHTYSAGGTYEIKITGVFTGWRVGNYADRLKILQIKQWGILRINSSGAFWGCSNLIVTAVDVLDTSDVTDCFAFFALCSSLTTLPNASLWDFSSATNFVAFFSGCTNFNSDISGWNVSQVTSFRECFLNCSSFNGDLSSWNMVSAKTLERCFEGCGSFNSDISGWNVSQVTSLYRCFYKCTNFNSNISDWDVTSVISLSSCFRECANFNADISNWSTSQVTNMFACFTSASSFDRLLNWDITAVTNITSMFLNVQLSTNNYDGILINWANQLVNNNLSFSGGASKYTPGGAAEAARNSLITTYGWTITDGGPA